MVKIYLQNNPGRFTPVHLLINYENKTMLQFKKKVLPLHIGVVLDESGSMSNIKEAAITSLNGQLESFRNEAAANGIETTISISTFSYAIKEFVKNIPIADTEDVDSASFRPSGGTALNDAIGSMINTLKEKSGMYLLLVVTDGNENYSRQFNAPTIRGMVIDSIATDLWTFAMCVPPGHKSTIAHNYGVPLECISEWEATEYGTKVMTQNIRASNTGLFTSYAAGQTRSSSYFTPDLNNLAQSTVAANLDEVTDQFKALSVPSKQSIRDFIQGEGYTFRVGDNFYQLTKRETIQDYKDIIIQSNSDGALYTGENARSLLRLPEGSSIALNPANTSDYTIYIRSTSWNRNLMPNSKVLLRNATQRRAVRKIAKRTTRSRTLSGIFN